MATLAAQPADDAPPQPWPERFERLAGAGALLTLAIGLATLAGWAGGRLDLASLFLGRPIWPVMGVTLVLQSLALLGLVRRDRSPTARRLLATMALVPALAGLAFAIENLTGLSLGIDTLLFPQEVARVPVPHPGRPPLQMLIPMILDGCAIALLDARSRRAGSPAEALALVAMVWPATALIGYGLNTSQLYSLSSYYQPPWPAATARVVMSLAILFARPERGVMAMIASPRPHGQMLRRMVPGLVLGALAFAALRQVAVRSHGLDRDLGSALLVLAFIALGLGLVSWNAWLLAKADATEQGLMAALRQRERQLREIIEGAPDAIVLVSAETGLIVSTNSQFQRLFGFSSEELRGQPIEVLLPLASRARHVDLCAAYAANPRTRVMGAELDLHGRRKDGSEFAVEVALSAVTAPEGAMIMAVVRDVTMQRQVSAEAVRRTEQLRQAQELAGLKDHLLSGLSHEMRTPLSLIRGYLELVEGYVPDKALVAGLYDGCRRLTEHLDAVFEYGALLAGQVQPYSTDVNLREVVGFALAAVEERAGAKGIQLTTHIPPGRPALLADVQHLTRVLVALLDNAVKFAPPGGAVAVDVLDEGAWVRFDVRDNGPGIPADKVEQAFEPFAQLDIGDAARKGGVGLGLAIAQKLVKLLGGTLHVTSRLGEGATFTLRLPSNPTP